MNTIFESKTPDWLLESAELKDRVLARFAEMPEAFREKVTSKDAWSAAEVVEHLILVEEHVAGPWRNTLGSSESAPGLKAGVSAAMVSTMFTRTNIRVPTVPELVPNGNLALPELTRRWDMARKECIAALPKDPKVAWIMHPVFGPLSSDQMGRILVAHLKHHLRHWPKVPQH